MWRLRITGRSNNLPTIPASQLSIDLWVCIMSGLASLIILKRDRIENKFDKPVQIVEVQTGPILKETDIIRYKDVYGRVN